MLNTRNTQGRKGILLLSKRYGYGRFCLCLLGLLFVLNTTCTFASPSPYALSKRVGEKQTVLRVYNRKTGRTIWERAFLDAYTTWPKDHRALAIYTSSGQIIHFAHTSSTPPDYHYSVGIWREGERVCLYSRQPYCTDDYIECFLWSPDDRFVLMMTGGSGEVDIGAGQLWCINAKTGAGRFICDMAANSNTGKGPKWHGSSEIFYHKMKPQGAHDWLASRMQYRYQCP